VEGLSVGIVGRHGQALLDLPHDYFLATGHHHAIHPHHPIQPPLEVQVLLLQAIKLLQLALQGLLGPSQLVLQLDDLLLVLLLEFVELRGVVFGAVILARPTLKTTDTVVELIGFEFVDVLLLLAEEFVEAAYASLLTL